MTRIPVGLRVAYVGSITEAHGLATVIGTYGDRLSLRLDRPITDGTRSSARLDNVRPQSVAALLPLS